MMISEQDMTAFLADYAARMLCCGATCVRIEKNVKRMAARFDFDADITVMPLHVEVSVHSAVNPSGCVVVRKICKGGISFSVNARLSRLSWDVADDKCGFDEARRRFSEIVRSRPTCKTEVLLLASLANASFCRLFGGDAAAMVTVFFATLAGMWLKGILMAGKVDMRVVVVCASVVSSSVCACGRLLGIGSTPEIALGVSVLYLVPGVPYISAVSDIIDRHYICAMGRLMDAVIITVCLSAGLCFGMFVTGLERF